MQDNAFENISVFYIILFLFLIKSYEMNEGKKLSSLLRYEKTDMSKLTTSKKIYLAAIICVMVIIFCFSATPIDQSTSESHTVGKAIGTVFVPGFKDEPEKKQLAFAIKIDHPVRKTAHMTEYAVFSIFLMLFFLPQNIANSKNINYEISVKQAESINSKNKINDNFDKYTESRNTNSKNNAILAFRIHHPVLSSALFSEAFALLYACTDEFISFSPMAEAAISPMCSSTLQARLLQ